jgi:hypothetical protein
MISPDALFSAGGFAERSFFGFLKGWWPYRHAKNVLFLHFSDMKKDHEGTIRKIADFLGFTPTEEQWPNILKYTSFQWMKENETKFEVQKLRKTNFHSSDFLDFFSSNISFTGCGLFSSCSNSLPWSDGSQGTNWSGP